MGFLWLWKDALGLVVPGWLNGTLAVLFLGLAGLFAWHEQYKRAQDALARLSPCLEIECGRHIPNCWTFIPNVTPPKFSFRPLVSNLTDIPVEECRAFLISIKREDGTTVEFGDSHVALTFAPAEEPEITGRRISPGVPLHLDLIWLIDTGVLCLGTKSTKLNDRDWPEHWMQLNQIFDGPGQFTLKVAVGGLGVPPAFATLKLFIAPDFKNSTCDKIA